MVSYQGTGRWRTDYRATPTNPGHKSDHNSAHDSSTQSWKLTYRGSVTVPTCGAPPGSEQDPCAALAGPTRARGTTRLTGKVSHRHVDGVFRVLNRTVRCSLRRQTRHLTHDASLGLAYSAERQTIGITASNPLSTALTLFPTACPRQGDSIDRLFDNYFTPGFSFDPRYGADRWFTSRRVEIPAAVWHRSREISLGLADTRAATPPRHCAVADRRREHCTARGAWRGVLTFRRRA
jgi:hypothetical protein